MFIYQLSEIITAVSHLQDTSGDDPILIRTKWDYAPHIDPKDVKEFYHTQRTRPHELLVDFILRRTEGALLLSGKRGVGKTSAVFSAIHTAIEKSEKSKTRILPILVNAPNFEIRKERQKNNDKANNYVESSDLKATDLGDFKHVVLQNLVRSLYQKIVVNDGASLPPTQTEVDSHGLYIIRRLITRVIRSITTKKDNTSNELYLKNREVEMKITDLYRRAVAKEVKRETSVSELEQETHRLESEAVMNVQATKELVGITGISFIAALLTSVYSIAGTGIWSKVLPLLIGVVPPALKSISLQIKKTVAKQRDSEKRGSLYYRYDYDVSTLESELQEALHKLSENNRVIFVIDELDKIHVNDVINVIRSLKILFNQSSAIFILITGKEFYDKMAESSEERPIEYTLFSQTIFLTRPLFQEMENFMNKILEKPTASDLENEVKYSRSKIAYHKYRDYVCYASKTDFYNLYNVLRDNISSCDFGLKLNIKLDQIQVLQASLQKAMGQVYLLKYYKNTSEWSKNDLLLDRMYELLTMLTEHKPGTEFDIETDPTYRILFTDANSPVDILNIPDKVEAGAVEDLIVYLTQLEALIRGPDNTYRMTGFVKEVPDKPVIYTQEELDFLGTYEKYQRILITYANLYQTYGNIEKNIQINTDNFIQYRNLISGIIVDKIGLKLDLSLGGLTSTIYDGLTSKTITHYDREDLTTPINQITGDCDYLLQNFILVIKNIFDSANPELLEEPDSLVSDDLVDDLGIVLPSKVTPTQCLLIESKSGSGEEKQILIIQNAPPELVTAIVEARKKRTRNFYVLLLSLNTTNGGDFTKNIDNLTQSNVDHFLNKIGVPDGKNTTKEVPDDTYDILNLEIPANEEIVGKLLHGILSMSFVRFLSGKIESRERSPRRQSTVTIPPPTGKAPYRLSIDRILPASEIKKIQESKNIIFHIIGSTGGIRDPKPQHLVARAMEVDFTKGYDSKKPSFLYLVGDLVYYSGQSSLYYSQFYEPYSRYPGPIFAIPGNHDGTLSPDNQEPPLTGFVRNFCATELKQTADAGDIQRSAMIQPNVYWTLEAPFVTIIGLYSNLPEGGWIDTTQFNWLVNELRGAPKSKALVVAVHHDPLSAAGYSGARAGSRVILQTLENAFKESERVADIVFSGHIHNYQRFTRKTNGNQIPYVVVGTGGYPTLHSFQKQPGETKIRGATGVTLEKYCDDHHGFMRVEASGEKLIGKYYTVSPAKTKSSSPYEMIDSFELDLQRHMLLRSAL